MKQFFNANSSTAEVQGCNRLIFTISIPISSLKETDENCQFYKLFIRVESVKKKTLKWSILIMSKNLKKSEKEATSQYF